MCCYGQRSKCDYHIAPPGAAANTILGSSTGLEQSRFKFSSWQGQHTSLLTNVTPSGKSNRLLPLFALQLWRFDRVMRAMALNLSKYHIRYTVERGMGANDRPDVRGALFAGGDCSERVSLSEGGEHQPRV